MFSRSSKQDGSRSCILGGSSSSSSRKRRYLSGIVWTLVLWILLVQLYMAIFPEQPILSPDPRSLKRSFLRIEENPGWEITTGFTMLDEQVMNNLLLIKNQSYLPNANLVIDPRNAPEDERQFFFPGRKWLDTDGNFIQAHGGGVLYVPQTATFYWYGENKDGPTYRNTSSEESLARVDVVGISCYSSRDLWLWKNEGLVLSGDKVNESSDLYITNVVERPKVIYNDRTGQFVMWMHIDNGNYSKASLGVAVSTRPEGPFQYVGSKQPHAFESRDMTLFKDTDGEAYVVYSSESNSALHITPLQHDYLDFRNIMARVFVEKHREAPAVFRHRAVYYMVTSDCTGWEPNVALVHAAENMLGPWQTLGNPCVGGNEEFRETTFFSQGSFVLPLPGFPSTFIFMADRWNSTDLRNSRYVWLPLTMDGPVDEPVIGKFEFPYWLRVSIRWHEKWRLPVGWNSPKTIQQ